MYPAYWLSVSGGTQNKAFHSQCPKLRCRLWVSAVRLAHASTASQAAPGTLIRCDGPAAGPAAWFPGPVPEPAPEPRSWFGEPPGLVPEPSVLVPEPSVL